MTAVVPGEAKVARALNATPQEAEQLRAVAALVGADIPTPLQVQVARVAHRCATDIRVPDADWPIVAAVIVLALPPVARAFAAAETMEALRARHSEVVTSTDLGDVRMCAACHVRYPCADARMLAAGEER